MSAEDNGELPEGWACATLADVVEDVPNVKPEDQPNRLFQYVDISSIDNDAYRLTETRAIRGKDAPSRARRPVRPGDVVFSNVRTYLRNIALIPDASAADVCSTGFTVLRAGVALDPFYLFRYVLTNEFIDRVTPEQTGTHYPATSDRVILDQTIPLPSLAEQRRIVAAVEAVLAKVNAARERLKRVPAILKRLRQAVLSAACSGRLTADWREKNPSLHLSDIPSKTPSDELPDSWSITSVASILAEPLANGRSVPDLTNGFPVLRLTAIKNRRIDLRERKLGDWTRADALRFFVRKDDYFVARGNGSLSLVGRGALLDQEPDEVAYPDTLIRLRVDRGTYLPELLALVWDADIVRDQIQAVARTSAGIHKISQPDIAAVTLPFPPLAEQQEIVRRVGKLFALADVIEARLTDARRMADQLTQAVLAKAFRGELVPTEAALARREKRTYEPAADLLARIRAEREQPAAPTRPQPDRTHRSAQPAAPKPPRDIKTVRLHRALVLAYFTDRQPKLNLLNRTRAIKLAAVAQWQFGTALALVPVRAERGPYDKAIEDIEKDAEKAGFIETYKKPKDGDGFAVRYRPGPKSAAACKKARALFGDALPAVDEFLDRMFEMNTDDVELFGTVYAAWNDLLLDNRPADNAAILAEVHGWHASKRDKFPKAAVRAMLARIREWGYIPTGTAPRTRRE